jgi:hypothetical protein
MSHLAPALAPATSERHRRTHAARTAFHGRSPARGFLALALMAGFGASLAFSGPQLVEYADDQRDTQPGVFALRGAADCGSLTLTQSTIPDVIGNTSVVCLDGAVSAENSAARAFIAPTTLTLKCVTFGVRINQGGDWPVDVRILTGDVLAGYDSLVLLSEASVVVPGDANRDFFTVDIPDVSMQSGATFVVELLSRSRRPADGGDGGQLAFGFNGQGQSAPTYFRGPLCGRDDFVDLASLGFPNLHLVMSVGYDEGATSLLLDGFHHNAAGGAIFLSDGSEDVIVEGDPMSGPFGFSVPYGSTTSGVQPPLVDWDVLPGTAMSFVYNLQSGETDILSLVANPDGSLTLETAFASFVNPVFDVQVFDGDQLVGEFTKQTSGDIMIVLGQPEDVPGWTAPCNYTRVTFMGQVIMIPNYNVRYSGNLSVWTVNTGPGTTHTGDNFNLVLSTTPGSTGSPPLSVDTLADGMISFKRHPRFEGVATGVRFGDASTSPRIVDGDFIADVGVLATSLAASGPITLWGDDVDMDGIADLRIANLGSTGKDGVELRFGGVDSANFDITVVNPAASGACVSFTAVQLMGGPGGTVALDPCVGCPPPFKGEWVNVVGDFAGVGSGTFTLQVIDDGQIVHQEAAAVNLAGSSVGWPRAGGKLGGDAPCWIVYYPPDTTFLVASTGQQLEMDEIRLLAENTPPLEYLDLIQVTAANMDELWLANPDTILPPPPEPCVGDTNGDNIVNFSDLNAALAQFGQSGPGLSADVNNDGFVDFGDLNTILSNFGFSCP